MGYGQFAMLSLSIFDDADLLIIWCSASWQSWGRRKVEGKNGSESQLSLFLLSSIPVLSTPAGRILAFEA